MRLTPGFSLVHQAPLSMEFSMQKYWNGLPFPFQGDLPKPGIEPASLVCLLYWQADSLPPCYLESANSPLIRISCLHPFIVGSGTLGGKQKFNRDARCRSSKEEAPQFP